MSKTVKVVIAVALLLVLMSCAVTVFLFARGFAKGLSQASVMLSTAEPAMATAQAGFATETGPFDNSGEWRSTPEPTTPQGTTVSGGTNPVDVSPQEVICQPSDLPGFTPHEVNTGVFNDKTAGGMPYETSFAVTYYDKDSEYVDGTIFCFVFKIDTPEYAKETFQETNWSTFLEDSLKNFVSKSEASVQTTKIKYLDVGSVDVKGVISDKTDSGDVWASARLKGRFIIISISFGKEYDAEDMAHTAVNAMYNRVPDNSGNSGSSTSFSPSDEHVVPTQAPVLTPAPEVNGGHTKQLPPGLYIVGKDIAPGLYVGMGGYGQLDFCYWARYKNADTNDVHNILGNANNYGKFYIRVKETDYALKTTCPITYLGTVTAHQGQYPTTIAPGTYLVNVDIRPGTYQGHAGNTLESACYWARLKDVDGRLDSVIKNGNMQGDFTVVVDQNDFALQTSCQLEFVKP